MTILERTQSLPESKSFYNNEIKPLLDKPTLNDQQIEVVSKKALNEMNQVRLGTEKSLSYHLLSYQQLSHDLKHLSKNLYERKTWWQRFIFWFRCFRTTGEKSLYDAVQEIENQYAKSKKLFFKAWNYKKPWLKCLFSSADPLQSIEKLPLTSQKSLSHPIKFSLSAQRVIGHGQPLHKILSNIPGLDLVLWMNKDLKEYLQMNWSRLLAENREEIILVLSKLSFLETLLTRLEKLKTLNAQKHCDGEKAYRIADILYDVKQQLRDMKLNEKLVIPGIEASNPESINLFLVQKKEDKYLVTNLKNHASTIHDLEQITQLIEPLPNKDIILVHTDLIRFLKRMLSNMLFKDLRFYLVNCSINRMQSANLGEAIRQMNRKSAISFEQEIEILNLGRQFLYKKKKSVLNLAKSQTEELVSTLKELETEIKTTEKTEATYREYDQKKQQNTLQKYVEDLEALLRTKVDTPGLIAMVGNMIGKGNTDEIESLKRQIEQIYEVLNNTDEPEKHLCELKKKLNALQEKYETTLQKKRVFDFWEENRKEMQHWK